MGGPGSGAKRIHKDKPCAKCSKMFRPAIAKVKFCSNSCRLKDLHEARRKKGGFFGRLLWKPEELDILRSMYPDPKHRLKDIQKLLPRRSIRAIKHICSNLGIKRDLKLLNIWRKDASNYVHYKKVPLFGKNNPFYGRTHTEKVKKILSEKTKLNTCFRRLNKDPEFQKKRRAALYAKPNKEELILDSLIQETCPNQFNFVGDGKFIIDGLNPDWVHVNKKLVIEYFGRSFHDPKCCSWEVPQRSTDKGRRKAFHKFGYKMLVIWDNELNKSNYNKIKSKILKFYNKFGRN